MSLINIAIKYFYFVRNKFIFNPIYYNTMPNYVVIIIIRINHLLNIFSNNIIVQMLTTNVLILGKGSACNFHTNYFLINIYR